MRKSILSILFNLGVHIGHFKQETRNHNQSKMVGYVNHVSIFNIQLTVFYLKRSLFFLKELGSRNGSLLFHSTNLYLFNQNMKQYLVHSIVLRERHSIFLEKWKNGCLSNYKTQVIDLLNLLENFKNEKNKKYSKRSSPKGYRLNYNSGRGGFFIEKKRYKYFFLYWLDFLVQLVFFIKNKKIEGLNWIQEWKRISKFWRFYHYFKFYNNFFT